jgi:radical SAM superfamily enzyme YgiQ (UPF0313 family)
VLASHLLRSGQSVSILDLDLTEKSASRGPEHYLDTFNATVRAQRPKAIGFTSMFNNSLHAERLIRATKALDSNIVTIAGGSHFGAMPQESLARIRELDFVIRGEGEIVLGQLLEALNSGTNALSIPGLFYRAPEGIRANPAGPLLDLKGVQPTWSGLDGVLDLRDYVATIPNDTPRKAVYIEAGRGCPFACTFCATAPFWQRRYRVKAINTIMAEMRHLYEEYRYDTFMLVHDLLTADKQFVADFCDALFSARLPVEWTANHRADIELGSLAPKMRSAGCLSVFMGIESASDKIQKEVQKGLTRNQIMSTVNSLRDVGISSTCSFIVGFPNETAGDLSATLQLATRLKMIGAEPVQVHRLRRWPPAPLARLDLPSSFDLEALRLEYPSDFVPDQDIQTIEADPVFFMGYFTPTTLAGSAFQLAQLELLFANVLAVFPITMGTLTTTYRQRLVTSYYKALAEHGPISRADLVSALSVRDTLEPFLSSWIARDRELNDWESVLLNSSLSYEHSRIGFMANETCTDAVASGDRWAVFRTAINVSKLVERLAAGEELTSDLRGDGYVALTRSEDGAIRGFGLLEKSLERLRKGDPELLSILENRAALV